MVEIKLVKEFSCRGRIVFGCIGVAGSISQSGLSEMTGIETKN